MTEEELKEKIADIIDREDKNSFALPCMDIANQISHQLIVPKNSNNL